MQTEEFNQPSNDTEVVFFKSNAFKISLELHGEGRILIEDLNATGQVAIFGGEDTRNIYPSRDLIYPVKLDEVLLSRETSKVHAFAQKMLETYQVKELVQCQNCGWIGDIREAEWASDLEQRHSMGSFYSDKECPQDECGSLVYPVEHKQSYPWETLVREAELPSLDDLEALENDLLYGAGNDIWAKLDKGSILNAEQQSAQAAMDTAAALINMLRCKLQDLKSTQDAQKKQQNIPTKEKSPVIALTQT